MSVMRLVPGSAKLKGKVGTQSTIMPVGQAQLPVGQADLGVTGIKYRLDGLSAQGGKTERAVKELQEALQIQEAGRVSAYQEGYLAGVKDFVTYGEEAAVRQYECKDRIELVQSGKLPAWWLLTLLNFMKRLPSQKHQRQEEDIVPPKEAE